MNEHREKFQSEDFHMTKIFVLVCRTGPAFDFVLFFEQRDEKQAHSAVTLTVPELLNQHC
jgi:hypothetical protein